MGAIADEIVAADPAAVGLQEVTHLDDVRLQPGQPAADEQPDRSPTTSCGLLLDALDERGADYHEVARCDRAQLRLAADPRTSPASATFPTAAVSLADRDVIIVARRRRGDERPHGNLRERSCSFPFGGAPLAVAAAGARPT